MTPMDRMARIEALAGKVTENDRDKAEQRRQDVQIEAAERSAAEQAARRTAQKGRNDAIARAVLCPATTLQGHRCVHQQGHAGAHMGTLPAGVKPDAAIGRTQWCRWGDKD